MGNQLSGKQKTNLSLLLAITCFITFFTSFLAVYFLDMPRFSMVVFSMVVFSFESVFITYAYKHYISIEEVRNKFKN